MDYILEMKDISKTFPGVKALDHVQLQVRPGEVHALMGENGAGKSTLMKILMGIYTKDEGGEILFNVWMLDSHDSLGDYMRRYHLGDPASKWDYQCAYPSCLHGWAQVPLLPERVPLLFMAENRQRPDTQTQTAP